MINTKKIGSVLKNLQISEDLELIDEKPLWEIDKINNFYAKKVPNAKSINKKYDKSKKQSYDAKPL